MKTREIKSLTSQLAYCYSLNKTIENPFAFHFCSYNGIIKDNLQAMGCHNWLVYHYENPFYELNIFQDVIYLSPDSSEILKEVSKDKAYIIGGLVDRPVSKNRSYYKASNLNIKTAKLPLEDYVDIENAVLNINTVVEILSEYIIIKDWGKVITKVIPKRMLK